MNSKFPNPFGHPMALSESPHIPAIGSYGDCYRTCLANMIGVSPSVIPHTVNDRADSQPITIEQAGDIMANDIDQFLKSIGFILMGFPIDVDHWPATLTALNEQPSGIAFIGIGRRYEHSENHACLFVDGQLVSDPADGDGIPYPTKEGHYIMQFPLKDWVGISHES